MSDSQDFFLRWRGKQLGPFSLKEINRKLDDHEIGLGHEIEYQGKWITLEEFLTAMNQAATLAVKITEGAPKSPSTLSSSTAAGTRKGIDSNQPPLRLVSTRASSADKHLAPPEVVAIPVRSTRRRLVYALIGVLLGFTGAHNYYARHWLTGLLQLLLSIATYLLGFGIVAPWLWALVETVVVRKDGYGLEMI
jgi:hypothetical protein